MGASRPNRSREGRSRPPQDHLDKGADQVQASAHDREIARDQVLCLVAVLISPRRGGVALAAPSYAAAMSLALIWSMPVSLRKAGTIFLIELLPCVLVIILRWRVACCCRAPSLLQEADSIMKETKAEAEARHLPRTHAMWATDCAAMQDTARDVDLCALPTCLRHACTI
jgi:hypothetical protein